MLLMSRSTIRPLKVAMLRVGPRRVRGAVRSCFVLNVY